MDLQQLRTFLAIADCGGVARAAARLNMSQPAASRQIQVLEASLGVPLFDRIGRRVQLTGEGADLLRRCREIVRQADLLRERALALKDGEAGVLTIGATPPMIAHVTMDAQYLGKETVTVAAGTFAARKFRFVDDGASGMDGAHPLYELWITDDEDAVFLQGGVGGYMMTWYELVELRR